MISLRSKGFFVCDYFTVDQANKASVIGMFQNITFPILPAKFLKFVLVFFLETSIKKPDDEKREIILNLHIEDPEGQRVNFPLPELKFMVDPAKPDGVISIDIGNFDFNKYGDYVFVMKKGNELLDTVKIKIKKE